MVWRHFHIACLIFNSPLRKHAYSNILKILPPKNENFQIKNSDIFHTSAQNIDCGHSLEPPRRGGSNEYPQSIFLSRNKKINEYPCKPQFYYIKRGLWRSNYIGVFSWCIQLHNVFSVQKKGLYVICRKWMSRCTIWPRPSFPTYRINRYSWIYWQTETQLFDQIGTDIGLYWTVDIHIIMTPGPVSCSKKKYQKYSPEYLFSQWHWW